MSRVQLALNVSDIDAAVAFYSRLFATEPAKRRPGYANFAIAEPPLKLVLIESAEARGTGVGGALNHLGVEVDTSAEVAAASSRLQGAGLPVVDETGTACCFALQDKVWAHDPDGTPWETYVVLADAPDASKVSTDAACCLPVVGQADQPAGAAHAVPVAATSAVPSTCC